MTGTLASRAMRSIRLLPPRGTMTSTWRSSATRCPTAARSVVATSCTAFSGRPAAAKAALHARGDRLVAVDRFGAAAQDRRIARLEAQAGGVRRHVRTRFVDDADDTERHAHQADLDARRAVLESVISPTGSGSAAMASTPAAIAAMPSASSVKRSTKACVVSGGDRRGDVLGIGGAKRRGVVADSGRHGGERGVLRPGVRPRDGGGGGARRRSDALHVGAHVGEGPEAGNGEVRHGQIVAREGALQGGKWDYARARTLIGPSLSTA